MTDKTMTLIQQLRGRAAFLRDKGRVKSPQLMEQAADAITRHLSQTAERGEAVARCCDHFSDCAVHNAPALPVGPCDCKSPPPAIDIAAVRDGMCATRPKPPLPISPLSPEDFCFCGNEVSLQWVSGGGSPDGYLGRVTLEINGEYVQYVRAIGDAK